MDKTQIPPVIKKNLSDLTEDTLNIYIKKLLESGNTKLPSEVELSKLLSISRTTIRRALSEMETKGKIIRIHGKGTFVNPYISQMNFDIYGSHNYYELIRERGYTPSVKLFNKEICESSLIQASKLEIQNNSKIFEICKEFYANDKLALICIDSIPVKYLNPKNINEIEIMNAPFELLQKYSLIRCVRDVTEISTAVGSDTIAYTKGKDLMNCDSVLVLDSIYFDTTNKPIFCSKTFFNTNYIKFSMTRTIDF